MLDESSALVDRRDETHDESGFAILDGSRLRPAHADVVQWGKWRRKQLEHQDIDAKPFDY